MMKKKIILPLMMLLLGATSMIAQDGKPQQGQKKKGHEMKVAYLTEELKITDAEAEKFWPVYDKHAEEKRGIRKSIKTLHESLKSDEKVSESQFNSVMNKISDLKIKEISLNKDYMNDVVAILGVQRTIQLVESERDFKKKIREKRKGNK